MGAFAYVHSAPGDVQVVREQAVLIFGLGRQDR